jgi:hypothetical protein
MNESFVPNMSVSNTTSVHLSDLDDTLAGLNHTLDLEKEFYEKETSPDAEYRGTIHRDIALVCMTLLFLYQVSLRISGYQLSLSSIHSTDAQAWMVMFLVSVIWTAIIVAAAVFWDDKSCRCGFGNCIASLAFVPWVLLMTSMFWPVKLLFREGRFLVQRWVSKVHGKHNHGLLYLSNICSSRYEINRSSRQPGIRINIE